MLYFYFSGLEEIIGQQKQAGKLGFACRRGGTAGTIKR